MTRARQFSGAIPPFRDETLSRLRLSARIGVEYFKGYAPEAYKKEQEVHEACAKLLREAIKTEQEAYEISNWQLKGFRLAGNPAGSE